MTQALSPTSLRSRLHREAEHFNQHEASGGIAPLTDFDKLRYTSPPADTIFPREYLYHLLPPLAGKDVLQIAAGNGIDASICAHNGANVHTCDLSQKDLYRVNQLAKINGVADRVHTQATGNFNKAFPGQIFDAILGYAALHHQTDLNTLNQQIHKRLKPSGVAVFAQPVVNSKMLDRLRKLIPHASHDIADDQQPMDDKQIADFAWPFDRIVRRDFQLTSRLSPIFPNNWPLNVALHKLDHYLLKPPFMRRFATVAVFGLYRDD